MNKSTEVQKHQYARLHDILLIGRQRYLAAGAIRQSNQY